MKGVTQASDQRCRTASQRYILRWLCYLPTVCGFLLFAAITHANTAAGTMIVNQASASYRDSDGVVRVTTSNIIETLIRQVAGLQLVQQQSRLAIGGRQVLLSHTLTNTGNGTDAFAISLSNVPGVDDFDLAELAIYADANQDGQPDNFVPITATPPLSMQAS